MTSPRFTESDSFGILRRMSSAQCETSSSKVSSYALIREVRAGLVKYFANALRTWNVHAQMIL